MTFPATSGKARSMIAVSMTVLLVLSGCSGSSSPSPTPTPPANRAPAFSSAATASVAENNGGVVYQATATDPDGDPVRLVFSGVDEALFSFDPATGELLFDEAPDFENPADSDGDNNYEVTFTASDGRGPATNFSVTFTVLDEPARDIVAFPSNGMLASQTGDLNSDGVADFIIIDRIAGSVYSGAEVSNHESDFTYAGFIGGLSLSSFENGHIEDILSLGDVDGDDVGEVMIALPEGANRSGEILVFSGSDLTASLLSLPATTATALLHFVDPDNRDASVPTKAGTSIAAIADLDGDDISEIVMGAPTTDLTDFDAGEAFLIYSTEYRADADGVIDLGEVGGSFGLRMQGAGTSYLAGAAATALGDVDGDDADDFAIGAENFNVPASMQGGVVTVLFGDEIFALGATTFDLTDISAGAGVDIISMEPNRIIGKYIATAGDVDGDGLDDILIGSPEANQDALENAGEVIVVYGSALAANAGGQIDLAALTPAQGFRILGADAKGRFGATLSPLGDLTGDGRDEFLVGAPTEYEVVSSTSQPTGPGAVYVFNGAGASSAVSGVIDLAALTPEQGIVIPGLNAEHGVGLFVDGLGDIDGDGRAEIVLGAYALTPASPTYYIAGRRLNAAFEDGEAEIALPIPPERP